MDDETILSECVAVAQQATCARSKCGSIIVTTTGEVIGRGYNSPPNECEAQRRCKNEKSMYHQKVTDKTCCIHAEQRALCDALRNSPESIHGATLYFIRLDADGNAQYAGKPYCTICSKMALDCGVAYFALWRKEGWERYDTETYNTLSYGFDGE
jgi:deoxycytidylate deaminase